MGQTDFSGSAASATSIGNEGLVTTPAGTTLPDAARQVASESPASEPAGAPGTLLGPSGDPLQAAARAAAGTDPQSTGSRGVGHDADRGAERGAIARNREQGGRQSAGDVQVRMDAQRGTGMVSWNTSPWTVLRSWSEQMDRMFDEMVRGLNPWRGTPVVSDLWATLQVPTVRTRRRNGGIEVVADLPGVDRKALEVSIDENVLTIAGERHDEEEQAHSGTASFAQRYGRFERTVLLPAEVDPEGAQATLRNGVLRVTLPVASHAQGRRINVRAE